MPPRLEQLDGLRLGDKASPATEARVSPCGRRATLLTGLLCPIAGHRTIHGFLPFQLNDGESKTQIHDRSLLSFANRTSPFSPPWAAAHRFTLWRRFISRAFP